MDQPPNPQDEDRVDQRWASQACPVLIVCQGQDEYTIAFTAITAIIISPPLPDIERRSQILWSGPGAIWVTEGVARQARDWWAGWLAR